MLLAVDIGNTNIAFGVFSENGELVYNSFLPNNRDFLSGNRSDAFLHKLKSEGIENINGAILSSVVPDLTENIFSALQNIVKGKIIKVTCSLARGIKIKNYDRERLGADRIADITAAVKLYGAPAAVFDLGTAATFSAADKTGAFIGGLIIPGLRLSLDCLSSNAALLPFVQIKEPKGFLGGDTPSSMLNGAVIATAAFIDSVSEKLEKYLNSPVLPVITGKAAEIVVPYCKRKLIYDEHLLLKGLKILYELNV